MSQAEIPPSRIRQVNRAPLRAEGEFVLYWMIAARRTRWNFALQHAIGRARDLRRPLVVLEAVRCDYPWANDRIHGFLLDGMAENAKRLARSSIHYFPFVEQAPGAGKGLLASLGGRACVVVTDDFPAFFLPSMIEAAGKRLSVLLEAVDGNGLLPMDLPGKAYPTAYAFRRFLQGNLPSYLLDAPRPDPLARLNLPRLTAPLAEERRWSPASLADLEASLDHLPIDHSVPRLPLRGGQTQARKALGVFLADKLRHYLDRNQPDRDVASGLSPYLHFGQLSSHEVFDALASSEEWGLQRLAHSCKGSRTGWWGVSPPAEAFLAQLVTWRELGFNACRFLEDYDRFESLPPWALKTLAFHASDPRPHCYTPKQFESARTHDPLWNAAQTQLVREGTVQNYLRMLWGKKILEWSRSPREALASMIQLNNKYALDGRDPNSYSGIFWILGRYDRPWGPERPIFGTVRYMTSESTARKLRLKNYLARYGA